MASRPPPDHTLFDALPCPLPSRRYNQAYNQTGCIRGASLEGSSCTRGRGATTKTKVLPSSWRKLGIRGRFTNLFRKEKEGERREGREGGRRRREEKEEDKMNFGRGSRFCVWK